MLSLNTQSSLNMPILDIKEESMAAYFEQLKSILEKENAVIVAHYYVDSAVQYLAEKTQGIVGDSLEMARFAHSHPADCIVVCGVEFMAETTKILSPKKRVISIDRQATCSLDIGCPADKFADFCDQYPNHTVVVYANTSAAVKARADWVVTSSIALSVVEHLQAQGKSILWAPDKHLGRYIQRVTGVDVVMWNGSCIVHEEFQDILMQQAKTLYPQALVLAHPESPIALLDLADFIGSTSQIIAYAKASDSNQFIIATERGIFYKLQQSCPGKEFIVAPTAGDGASCQSCSRCPWMAMGTVDKLLNCFHDNNNEVLLEDDIVKSAQASLMRMIQFKGAEAKHSFFQ